jgi:hypothetical protein
MTPVEHIRVEDLPELEKTAAVLLAEIESAAMTREELRDRLVKIDSELETIEAKRTEAAHKLAGGDAKAGAVLDALDADDRRKRHLRRGVTQHLATVQHQIVAKEQQHGEHREAIAHASRRVRAMELEQICDTLKADCLYAYKLLASKLAEYCTASQERRDLGQPALGAAAQMDEALFEVCRPLHLEQSGWTSPGVGVGMNWQFPVRPMQPPKKG